jgi:hypothetical protein
MKTKDKAMQWNNDEANQLFAIITKVCELEKAYGQPGKDAKAICKVLEGWLHEDFTAAQVVYAVGELVKQCVKVPMPDEIRAFLNPQDRKITVGEYIQARKDYADNGKQIGCQHLDTIMRFQDQNADERKGIERRKERAASLGYDGHKVVLSDETVEFYLPKKFNQPSMKKIGDLS